MLIRNVRLIDGTGEVIDGADLRVRDGRWAEVGRSLSPGGDEAVDLGGAVAMPGLIDAHTHLTLDASARSVEGELRLAGAHALAYQAVLTERRAEALLAQGVTTARDVGGTAPVILAVRDAIARGHARGPRIAAAGHWLTVTGGHGWTVGVEADGPDALRRAVRDEIKAGVDMIKLMVSGGVVGPGLGPQSVQFSEDEVRLAADIAHGNAMPIAAHAHGAGAIRSAVLGGVDTVEHGSYLTEDLAHEMLRRGTFLTPTLAVIAFIIEHAGDSAGHAVERATELYEAHRANVAMAHRLGVPLVAGTDMGAPHTGPDSIHAELEHLVQIGLTPMEAIGAATQTAARAMRREQDLGTVEVGRRADLLVLDRDPLEDIRATRSLRHLLQDGRWVMRDGLPCAASGAGAA